MRGSAMRRVLLRGASRGVHVATAERLLGLGAIAGLSKARRVVDPLTMLGTLVHVGGPAPLRAGVSYSYPFERYAAHLPSSNEHCLRLPWEQRHARDDVGVVQHEEQESFVSEVLARAGIPRRTGAPGEHIFASAHEARRAAAAISAVLREPWGLTFPVGDRVATVQPWRRTPALVVQWAALRGHDGGTWDDEALVGFDALDGELGARLTSRWLDAATRELVRDAVRASAPHTFETPGQLVRVWSRTNSKGFLPGDLDEVDELRIGANGAIFRSYTHSYGDRSPTTERRHPLAEVARADWPLRKAFRELVPRIDAYLDDLGVSR
ncbi:MAG: hypothetical protein K1X94_19425 [Sandaracinaceae bacterium]|nr:hypothetical protein [Sandaracinaceae bacterium]